MGVSSFLKNLFGTAKETATTLTNQADKSLEQAKDNIKPFLEKLEDYTEDIIDKTKTTAKPYFKQAESLVEETFVKAKQSTEPYIEKTKIYATENFEAIKENTAPIIVNIENLAVQTKEKMNEYADKAEELLDKIKNNYNDKAEANLIIKSVATDIEISKLESIDLATDRVNNGSDNLITDTTDSTKKVTEFTVISKTIITATVEKSNSDGINVNSAVEIKKISKKTINLSDDIENKDH